MGRSKWNSKKGKKQQQRKNKDYDDKDHNVTLLKIISIFKGILKPLPNI